MNILKYSKFLFVALAGVSSLYADNDNSIARGGSENRQSHENFNYDRKFDSGRGSYDNRGMYDRRYDGRQMNDYQYYRGGYPNTVVAPQGGVYVAPQPMQNSSTQLYYYDQQLPN